MTSATRASLAARCCAMPETGMASNPIAIHHASCLKLPPQVSTVYQTRPLAAPREHPEISRGMRDRIHGALHLTTAMPEGLSYFHLAVSAAIVFGAFVVRAISGFGAGMIGI